MSAEVTQAGNDVFDSSAQAAFIKQFSSQLVSNLQLTATGTSSGQIEPLAMIDTMVAALRQAGADDEYIQAVEGLKSDPSLEAELLKFQQALDGKGDITEVAKLPESDDSSGPTVDPGLNGEVLLGDDGDLVRYSDYISGAGTTVGGFASGLPSGVMGILSNSSQIDRLKEVSRLEKRLQKDFSSLVNIIEQNRQLNFDVEGAYHNRSNFTIHTIDGKDIDVIRNLSPKDKALLQVKETTAALNRADAVAESKALSRQMLSNVGTGVKIASTGFGIAMGGVGIAAGVEKLEDAAKQLDEGKISQAEYDKLVVKARLRTAGGAMGLAKGVSNIGEFVATKIAKSVSKEAGEKASRFAPVVGNVIGIGMGVMSVTKNAMAADEARRDGNHGRAAMFGVMAALDSVTVVLDGISMGLDLFPGLGTLASFVVDLVSTVIGFVSDLIGFFTELVDTRSPEEKLQAEFNKFIDSDEFKTYVDDLAANYEKQGYDVMKFYIDSEGAGLDAEEEIRQKVAAHEEIRNLTDKARQDVDNLRLAIIDNTYGDNIREGGAADDLINVIGGGNKTLYGHGGDDLIFDAGGDSTLKGGKGNDYLNGGAGADKLYGGEGDDQVVFEPGIDRVADGGPGKDTLIVPGSQGYTKDTYLNHRYYYHEHGTTLVSHETRGNLRPDGPIAPGEVVKPVNRIDAGGVYIDLENRSAGFSLGTAFMVDEGALSQTLSSGDKGYFNAYYDQFASAEEKQKQLDNEKENFRQLRNLYHRNGTQDIGTYEDLQAQLGDKHLWFLGRDSSDVTYQKSYFTDGEYLYEIELLQGQLNGSIVGKSDFRLQDIANSVVSWERPADYQWINGFYHENQQVEAQLYLAFSSTDLVQEFENVVVDADTVATIFGDNADNMIRVGQQVNRTRKGGLVDARGGNDTIVVERAANRYNLYADSFWHSTEVRGGQGYDTLVLASDDPQSERITESGSSYQYSYVLVDPNSPKTIDTWKLGGQRSDQRGSYYDIISVSGVESVVLDESRLDQTEPRPIYLDASELSTGLMITANSDNKVTVKTTGQDDTLRIVNAADGSEFSNSGGRDLLDFSDYAGSGAVSVDLGFNTISGGLQATLEGFDNARASRFTGDQLKGNDNDNLLMAYGGSDTLDGRWGNDHLVAGRGQHTLIGDKGADTYTLQGPVIEENVAITVKRDKDNQLSASGSQGSWQDNKLILDVLGDDAATLNFGEIKFVDSEGHTVTGKGSLSIENNKIVYTPGSEFNDLQRHEETTLRISYQTEGSLARIDEADNGNLLRVGHFNSVDEIQADLDDNNNLVIKDADGKVVFVDLNWGKQFAAGKTNLLDLAVDFANRFPTLILTKANTTLDKNAIYNLLTTQLSDKLQQENAPWDMHVVTSRNTARQGGSGNDLFVADLYGDGKAGAASIATGAGNDTIVATSGTQVGSGNHTEIRTGAGNDVVILGNSDRVVDVRFEGNTGNKILKMENWSANSLQVESDGSNGYRFRINGTLVATLDEAPDAIGFSDGDKTWIVSDVPAYLTARMQGQSYPLTRFLDQNENMGLRFADLHSDQVSLDISKAAQGVDISLMAGDKAIYTFSLPDLTETELAINGLSLGLALQIAGGIEFADQALDLNATSSWLGEMLRDSSRHSLDDGLSLHESVSGGEETEVLVPVWQELPLVNASFEANTLENDYTIYRENKSTDIFGGPIDIPGWEYSGFGSGSGGISSDKKGQGIDGGASDGTNMGYLPDGASMSQVVGTFEANSQYRVSLDFHSSRSGMEVRLWAGDTLVGKKVLTEADTAGMFAYPNHRSWQNVTMEVDGSSFQARAADGQPLKLEIVNATGTSQYDSVKVDNIHLSQLVMVKQSEAEKSVAPKPDVTPEPTPEPIPPFIELIDESNTLTGWEVDKGGDGFAVQENGLVASYEWSSRTRRFDVSELISTYGANSINVSESFFKVGYTADSYKLTVRLLDSDGSELQSWSTGEQQVADVAEVSHTFVNYSDQVHFVEVTDAGKDNEYWAGHWGARMEGLQIQFETASAGTVNSQADAQALRVGMVNVEEQSASVVNSDADSVRVAKLTGAMAAFDSSSDGTSSGNEVLDGRYNLQPELTAAVV